VVHELTPTEDENVSLWHRVGSISFPLDGERAGIGVLRAIDPSPLPLSFPVKGKEQSAVAVGYFI
jgi:hypothetical protein